MPQVSVVQVTEDVRAAVGEAMELACWKDFIEPGAPVSLKVNLGWDMFLPGAVSAPWVVEGVVETIKGHVGPIYLVESSQVLVNVEKALRQTGLDKVCEQQGVEWVNMSKGPFKRVKLDGNAVLKEVELPRILLETQVITLPVMKTHGRTTITGAIKNQWGCLKELRHNYHPVVNEALADVNSLVRPKFAVMDGTVGLEGNGPKSGRPRIADLVLASSDIVALDSVAATIMGFDPGEIKHIGYAHDRGLGENNPAQIDVVGDGREVRVAFASGKNNTVAVVEMALRHRLTKRLVFDTFLFKWFCYGAIGWYYVWYALKGRRLRDAVLKDPKYGPQWADGRGVSYWR